MFDLKSFVYLPNVSESHYSFLTTFLSNSFFIKFDELEIFLFFYYSSHILENKNKNKNNFNLLHVDFFFFLSQLCLIYFYFKSKNNWLFLLLIKASMRKKGNQQNLKEKQLAFFPLYYPNSLQLRTKKFIFFYSKLEKIFYFQIFCLELEIRQKNWI